MSEPSTLRAAAAAAFIAAAPWFVGCAGGSNRVAEPLAPSSVPSAPTQAPETTYLAVVPAAFEDVLDPLVAIRRAEGHGVLVVTVEDAIAASPGPSPAASLRAFVETTAAAHPALRYLLLAGDPRVEPVGVPTFTETLGEWADRHAGSRYASDHAYALTDVHPLAVGRLPARTVDELTAMVQKTVAYAGARPGPWQSRMAFFAGPARMGPADLLIETAAREMIDRRTRPEFEIPTMFAQASSPYADRFDRMRERLVAELGRGSLLAVFAGHGSETSLDTVVFRRRGYAMGTASDLARVNVTEGPPIFVALTCSAGAFDRDRRSIAEAAVLNPRGPVATFAASTISGAYPNLLFAESLLDELMRQREERIGDAFLDAKTALPTTSSPLILAAGHAIGDGVEGKDPRSIAEHPRIYNLFGDPALEPRYPATLRVTLEPSEAAPGSRVTVQLDGVPDGVVTGQFTLELPRTEVKPGVRTDLPDELEAAFAVMAQNHALANDKVLRSATVDLSQEALPGHLAAPDEAGEYRVKVTLSGAAAYAVGTATLLVR